MEAIKRLLTRYVRNDEGAVTVDWIALVAVIVMLGMAAGFSVSSSVPELANNMSSFLSNSPVGPN